MSTHLPPEIAHRTVRAVLDAQAEERGEALALIAVSRVSGSEERLTYAQLRRESIRVAGALAALGVGPGARVAIMLDNDAGVEAHLAYHAAHRLGAVVVPVNSRFVARELAHTLAVARPAALVHDVRFSGLLDELGPALADVELVSVAPDTPSGALGGRLARLLADGPPAPPPAPLGEDDIADLVFTSGTTGEPKAVAFPHHAAVATGHQAIPLWGLDEASVYQSSAPFFTSTGCRTNLLACLVAGCTYALEPEFHVDRTLERMRRWGTTSTFLVNSVLALIFDRRGEEALTEGDFPALRRICWGAQANGVAFARRVYAVAERMGIELTNVYGMTESGNSGIMLVPEDHAEAIERAGDEGVSIGRTPFHPWVEFTLLRPDGTPADVGEAAELCLRAPSMMTGYLDDPEGSADALRHGWLYTGDICRRDAAGFVYFVDRRKQMIRPGGLNVSSAEVEGVILAHPGIAEVAVVPRPNPVLGEDVRAVCVAAGQPPPDAEEVIAFCAQRLADYKVPATVEFVDALPRNGMGRVVKRALTS